MKILENPQTSRARIPIQKYVVFLAGKVFWGEDRILVLQKAVEVYLQERAAGNINRYNSRLILGEGFLKRKNFRRIPARDEPWERIPAKKRTT